MKRRKTTECQICGREYDRKVKFSRHHVLPKRYFKGNGKVEEICRDCHDELEFIIKKQECKDNKRTKLTAKEYHVIFVLYKASKGG